MSESVGLRDLRHDTRSVIDRALEHGGVTITDHGKPIAIIVPPESERPRLDRVLRLLSGSTPTDTGWFEEFAVERRREADRPDRF
jgi:prevent-host-death family protein